MIKDEDFKTVSKAETSFSSMQEYESRRSSISSEESRRSSISNEESLSEESDCFRKEKTKKKCKICGNSFKNLKQHKIRIQ